MTLFAMAYTSTRKSPQPIVCGRIRWKSRREGRIEPILSSWKDKMEKHL